jgi:calcineurin-like phosphoesterase family protein
VRAALARLSMTLFFTADTHFGDHRTLNLHQRPFNSVVEMDEALIAGWNAIVGADDVVWHLGDVARRPADVPALLARLHGTKHLLRGNNDPPATGDGHSLVLCHYPFRSWNGQHRRVINLHGHSHGKLKPMLRQFDVGVDVHGFAPITLPRLLSPERASR